MGTAYVRRGTWESDRRSTRPPGDVVVVNPGVDHELHSELGVEFFEALRPCRAAAARRLSSAGGQLGSTLPPVLGGLVVG